MESPATPLDDQTLRNLLLIEMQAHLIRVFGLAVPEVAAADGMRDLARKLAGVAEIEARLGVRTEPVYPGFAEPPDAMGSSWRMICMTRVHAASGRIGTLVTTLVSGRKPSVVVAPAEALIPSHFVQLVRR